MHPTDSKSQPLPDELVGTFRTIGTIGPVYEIVGRQAPDDLTLAPIRVLESGEETDYPIADILQDPIAP
ncbi:MAG: DUF5397 family protein [Candidatus Eremiobacteraeota bacterium]|nr:DUF5397 family protein [Candidatus Eremiobacteraeota bacterium]